MVSVLESLMKKDSFIHMKLRDCVASVGGEKDCSHVLLPTNALIGPGRHREGDSLRGSRGTRKWLLGLTFFYFFFFFCILSFNHLDTWNVSVSTQIKRCSANTDITAPFLPVLVFVSLIC